MTGTERQSASPRQTGCAADASMKGLHWRCSRDARAGRADGLADDRAGRWATTTYVVNRNINFSNVCYVGCRFCAFAQRERDADAYRLSVDEVADRAEEAWQAGATEVCLQGGIDPKLPVTVYANIVRAIKARVPGMHVHAFSPMEIATASAKAGVRCWRVVSLRERAGHDPDGGGDPCRRRRWIHQGKLPAATWGVSARARVGAVERDEMYGTRSPGR